jgi:hydroxymethylbilane synthase
MPRRGSVRLATRGSQLALQQARSVGTRLEDRRYETEFVEVSTRGDDIRDELIHELGRKGAFVRSVDEAVLRDEADAAVHSLKDLPTEGGNDIIVAAVPERGPAADVLITPDGKELSELPAGATVGTASQRRTAQLLAERPDLDVKPLRGNVDTRVQTVLAPTLQAEHERLLEASDADGDSESTAEQQADTEGMDPDEWFTDLSEIERQALGRTVETEYDAIVLARAGLERLGIAEEVPLVDLPSEGFVPAPGQGALAVTAAPNDVAGKLRRALEHPPTRVAVTTERTVLATLGGGCVAPIGVHATVRGSMVNVRAQVMGGEGDVMLSESREIPVERHREGAQDLAEDLAERGARDLIEAATEE